MEINNLNKTDDISPLQFSDEFIDQANDQDELPIQLTYITGTKLQEMNDDCLLKIFKSLTLMDLCSIAKTCERFQQVALRAFPKEFSISNEGEEGYFVIASRNFCLIRRKREEIERIFTSFGFCPESSFPKLEQFMPKLEQFMPKKNSTLKFIYRHLTLKILDLDIGIRDFRSNQHMLQIIGNSCKELEELTINLGSSSEETVVSLQPLQSLKLLRALEIWNVSFEDSDFFSSLTNLEKLKIYDSKIPQILTRSKPIFKRLQVLKLDCCSVEDWTLFAQCDSLVELELCGMSSCGSNVFPKLERFTYSPKYVDVEFLLAFISRHWSLKKLVTYGNCDNRNRVMILQEIDNSCKELEKLVLSFDSPSLQYTVASLPPLQSLKLLRTLKIFNVSLEDSEFFSSLTNLEKLEIYDSKIPKILTIKSKPIFKRLQLLSLFRCSVEDWTLFAQCDSLVELKLRGMNNCGSIVFPKLERFTYASLDVDVESLLAFISRHKSLKTLVTDGRCHDSDRVMILQEIGNSCKELEELEIWLIDDITDASIQQLKALKSLRKLLLYEVSFKDFKFFSSLTILRELRLIDCYLPEKSKQFDFLVQLTKLEITGFLYDAFDVVGIISRLTKLEEFTLSRCRLVLDEKTFSRIVGIVKKRPNVLTLKCNFNFDLKNFDQNERVRLIKMEWWE